MFESVDLASRPNWKLRMAFAAITLALIAGAIWLFRMTEMPLKSYGGPTLPLNAQESELRDHLLSDVRYLSVSIGERSIERVGSLEKAAAFIRENLRSSGYVVNDVQYGVAGQQVSNVEAILVGTEIPQETVVVGAHYDSVAGTVRANDNASGVAAVLERTRLFGQLSPGGQCAFCSSSMKHHPTCKPKI